MTTRKKPKPESRERKTPTPKGRDHVVNRVINAGFMECSGLMTLAARYGVDADALLAVTCQLLRGVAGGGAWIGDLAGGISMPKSDSLMPGEAHSARRAVEHLVARLRLVNNELSAAMSSYSPEVLGGVMHGAFAGGKSAKVASDEDTRNAAERHRQVLERSPGDRDLLEGDLARGAESRNIEAALHPSVLVEHTRVRDLVSALDACHQRSAIVVAPKLYSNREGPEPVKDLELLRELLDGMCLPDHPAVYGRPASMLFSAHAILVAGNRDLEKMAASVPELPGKMLWLSFDPADRPKVDPAARTATSSKASADVSTLWTRAFDATIRQLLEMRRSGRVVAVDFTGPDEAMAFWRMTGSFRESCASLARDAAVEEWNVTGDLAIILFWGMRAMLASMPAGLPERFQSGLLDEAFAVAGRLVKRHFLSLGGFLRRDQIRRQLLLAERVVELVQEKEPLSRRNLVRCFNNQLLARFVPVLDALQAAGVVGVDGEGAFVSGDVPWMEAKGEFAAALLSPGTEPLTGPGELPVEKDKGRVGENPGL